MHEKCFLWPCFLGYTPPAQLSLHFTEACRCHALSYLFLSLRPVGEELLPNDCYAKPELYIRNAISPLLNGEKMLEFEEV